MDRIANLEEALNSALRRIAALEAEVASLRVAALADWKPVALPATIRTNVDPVPRRTEIYCKDGA